MFWLVCPFDQCALLTDQIFNLGASDLRSFESHADDYNRTNRELRASFEETYISLIKAVRNLAYPMHPATIESQRLGLESIVDINAPANIPIFIMRPFDGQLEHATQSAVHRLRDDGDKSVFWLDTSGWLDGDGHSEALGTTNTASTNRKTDWFVETSPNGLTNRTYLTERGNQKVAIYLHMHTCRYLAAEDEKCAFLPPEVYQGNVYDVNQATFDQYIETEKERQLKQIFWEQEANKGL